LSYVVDSQSPAPSLTCAFFVCLVRPRPGSTLFPYTTLFRSLGPLPGLEGPGLFEDVVFERVAEEGRAGGVAVAIEDPRGCLRYIDRKSTRLNSSHVKISYAVFCLKKKKSPAHSRRVKTLTHP